MSKPDWYEWFPGHYFLPTPIPGLRVHIDARGDNIMHPVAIIESETSAGLISIFYKTCDTFEEAQSNVEARLGVLANSLASVVQGSSSKVSTLTASGPFSGEEMAERVTRMLMQGGEIQP